MTDQTTTADNQDPMQTIAELVRVLKEDLQLRTQTIQQMNELLERRNDMMQSRAETIGERNRVELEKKLQIEQQTMKRAKWYTGVLALFAIIMGVALFYMVYAMTRDMNRMEDYMYNMGHAASDQRRISKLERKVIGPSFMDAMATDMGTMRTDMATMSARMTAMSTDMGTMRGAISNMDGTIGTLGTDIGQMSTDMTTMNGTMGRMQYDTLWMRQGVGNMSNDTRAMGAPFRAMDSFMPW